MKTTKSKDYIVRINFNTDGQIKFLENALVQSMLGLQGFCETTNTWHLCSVELIDVKNGNTQ